MPTLIGLTLSISTVPAFADSGWYYDEDSDTVIHNFDGSAVTHPSSHSNNAVVQHSGKWYYDESSDNIVYIVNGSRYHAVQTGPSTDAIGFDSNLAYLDL
jgi:hypothetical protein